LICKWVDRATKEISKQTIFNAWRHDRYTWFLQGAMTNPFDANESRIEETDSDNEIENKIGDNNDCSDEDDRSKSSDSNSFNSRDSGV
jgi:hypothetical protein